MPFVLAIMIIILIFISGAESSKKNKENLNNLSQDMAKTYVELEDNILQQYLVDGKQFDEAYALTRIDMRKRGFEPIIPKNFYDVFDEEFCKKIGIDRVYAKLNQKAKYHLENSKLVQVRREKFFKRWTDNNPDVMPPIPTIDDIYNDWPTSIWAFKKEVSLWEREKSLYNIGTFVEFKKDKRIGEIISIDEKMVHYSVKMLDDESIKSVWVLSSKIRRVE